MNFWSYPLQRINKPVVIILCRLSYFALLTRCLFKYMSMNIQRHFEHSWYTSLVDHKRACFTNTELAEELYVCVCNTKSIQFSYPSRFSSISDSVTNSGSYNLNNPATPYQSSVIQTEHVQKKPPEPHNKGVHNMPVHVSEFAIVWSWADSNTLGPLSCKFAWSE